MEMGTGFFGMGMKLWGTGFDRLGKYIGTGWGREKFMGLIHVTVSCYSGGGDLDGHDLQFRFAPPPTGAFVIS